MSTPLRLEVGIGTVAVHRDRLVVVEQRYGTDRVRIRDLATGERLNAAVGALRSRPTLSAADLGRREEMLRTTAQGPWAAGTVRELAIRALLQQDGPLGQRVRVAALELKVSERTVFRWLARFVEAEQTTSIVPHRRGRKPGAKVLDVERERLIDTVIADTYLKRPRARPETIYREVNMRCGATGLPPVSRNAVIARIRRLDPQLVARKRHGAKHARNNVDPAPGRYRVEGAGDVLQIDHTLADVHLVDRQFRQSIGRPWLTLAVDVATRAVYGFHVSLEPPSALSIALCLSHAAAAKDEWLAARGLELRWPMSGLPGTVHADNGKDLRGEALERGCQEYGIGLQFRPLGRAHYGGHIERLIGTLMGEVHLLPGTTYSNIKDRGEDPAEEEAVMTLPEFEEWLAIGICNGYHAKPHRSLGVSPLAAWQAQVRQLPSRAMPGDPCRFLRAFLPVERRTFGRSGIQFQHIHYWSDVLPTLAHLGDTLIIRYDPRDLSRLYVLGPEGQYFEVPYANLLNPPVTLWELEAASRRLHAAGRQHLREAAVFESITEQRRRVAESASTTKQARRQQERRRVPSDHPSAPASPAPVDYSKDPVPYPSESFGTDP